MEEEMANDGQSIISLKNLSLMTGLSEGLIVDELLLNHEVHEKGEIGLGDLRKAMIKYLDRSIVVEKSGP